MSKLIETRDLFPELKSVLEIYNNCDAVKPFVVDDLIKKLQQLRGQPMSDLISKSGTAKDIIHALEYCDGGGNCDGCMLKHYCPLDFKKDGFDILIEFINTQPAVEPERTATRTGLDGPNSIFDLYECSNCGNADSKRHKYCPNCGAKFTQEEPNE